MSTIKEIEQAIEQLPEEEFRKLREWFANRDAEAWDSQFAADVQAGKLDALAEEALRDVREGRSTEL